MGKTFGEFMDYFSVCYRRSRGSIFIGGFVGGMFLSFLMDESEKCHDRSFTQAFFIIGITHFLSNIVGGAASYAKEASQADADITLFERKIQLLMVFLQHVLKIVQYPLVFWLGFHVIKFNSGNWTHDRGEVKPAGASSTNCEVCFCDRNTVNLAILVFIFQIVYGLVSLGCMVFMWYVDSDDDVAEMKEAAEWAEAEKMEAMTWKGKLKKVLQLLSMDPFFNGQIAGVTLSVSVALPHTVCPIHITEWFLVIGLVSCVTGVFMQLTRQVEVLAAKNGIINRAENILIDILKLLRLPLFSMELIAYGAVVFKVFSEWQYINFSDPDSSHYCSEGIWHVMLVIAIVYTLILAFRILAIIASLIGTKPAEVPKED